MKTITSRNMAWSPLGTSGFVALLFAMQVLVGGNAITVNAADTLFDSPRVPALADEILLVSTRAVGTVCNGEKLAKGLVCERYAVGPKGALAWRKSDWRRLLSDDDDRPTVIYVHGNRVGPGTDRTQGLEAYSSFKKHSAAVGPVRFVIWSWPSTKLRRPVKDYRVKAIRTMPVAWQLAWFLDKLPMENRISLVGYSYGTRVVTGAAHFLAGGKLGALSLKKRLHPERPPVRAALIAAAYNADWLEPDGVYGRAIRQLEQVLIVTNEHDIAMHYYHLSTGLQHMDALGRSGLHSPGRLGTNMLRVRLIDFSREVGRSHAISDYLAADEKMSQLWRQTVLPVEQAGGLSDTTSSGYQGLRAAIEASRKHIGAAF